MSKVKVNIVAGNSGYSLQVVDEKGNGNRVAGEKAWGNPHNTPTASFVLDTEEFIDAINTASYSEKGEKENETK